jgi:hypothetical protein
MSNTTWSFTKRLMALPIVLEMEFNTTRKQISAVFLFLTNM